jgi:serine/threonine protein phosphatase PrpC
MSHRRAFRWSSCSLTHVGNVRSVNEDACLELPDCGLWAVADGMGGHDAGDVASQMIVDALRTVAPPRRFNEYVDDVEDRLMEVNRKLIAMAQGANASTIGSTVVVLLTYANYCFCLWAGDSRLYRFRNGQLQQLTQDHSQIEELIEQGELRREEGETHPAANVITRAVGATRELFLDATMVKLEENDQFILCSDGLFKDVREMEIADVMNNTGLDTVCKALVDLALQRSGRDNVSVVCVRFNKIDYTHQD